MNSLIEHLDSTIAKECVRYQFENEMKNAKQAAFAIYAQVLSTEQVRKIELDFDHGWFHVRRVLKHLVFNCLNSAEITNRDRSFFDRFEGVALGARFHDIFQQLYGTKHLHAQMGTVFTAVKLLEYIDSHPEQSELDLTDQDVYTTLVMIYHHSDPSHIEAKKEMLPPLAVLAEVCLQQLQSGKLVDKLESQQRLELIGLFSSNINRLKKFDFRIASPDESEKQELGMLARRLALADKLDAMMPAREANWRLICSSEKIGSTLRPLYRPIAKEMIVSTLTDLIAEKEQLSQDEHQAKAECDHQIDRLISYREQVAEGELSLVDELRYRIIAGEGIAPDDFSRLLYELTRSFAAYNPTAFEKDRIRQSFEQRAEGMKDFIDLLKRLAQAREDRTINDFDWQSEPLVQELFDQYIEQMQQGESRDLAAFMQQERQNFIRLMVEKAKLLQKTGIESIERMRAILNLDELPRFNPNGVSDPALSQHQVIGEDPLDAVNAPFLLCDVERQLERQQQLL
mgnify:CR=1 FL=1